MEPHDDTPRIPLQITRSILVASIQIDLSEAVLHRLRDDLLRRLHEQPVKCVIIDLAGVSIIDCHEFEILRKTLSMISMMGARPIVSGLRPGVVSALIGLGADIHGIEAVLSLEDAYAALEQSPRGIR